MSQSRLRTTYALTAICLILTVLIGVFVTPLQLNVVECSIVLNLQTAAQRTVGLEAFQVLTYLGDFYLWVIFASVYLLYAYFESRKLLDSAVELAVFLVITTALTYSMKMFFARPRPSCSSLSVYDNDFVSSFSYPSGHVSRAVGAFIILSRGSRTRESLAVVAMSIVSLSRIILGGHYLTDVVGGVFLSLAAQRLANLSARYFRQV